MDSLPASIVELVDLVIRHAEEQGASDIHIDPTEHCLLVRLRIDGRLIEYQRLSKQRHAGTIFRIKVLAGLRTDEHQRAQDGRVRYVLAATKHVDLRVSIIPTHYGENAVMRLLRPTFSLPLADLGFNSRDSSNILEAMKRTSGAIFCTGPTGSGKTTTLYSLIALLSTADASIITLEDPVESALPFVRQIQINEKVGLGFPQALRSILRQDPDVLMVGEVRDGETAKISMHMSLTGHLMLSSLHAVNSVATLPRLLDMGIEPYLLASSINLIIAQRLVRKLCTCREKIEGIFGLAYRPIGCDRCGGSGYMGRMAIAESLVIDQTIKELVVRGEGISKITMHALSSGMIPMRADGQEKVRQGLTTLEELERVLYE